MEDIEHIEWLNIVDIFYLNVRLFYLQGIYQGILSTNFQIAGREDHEKRSEKARKEKCTERSQNEKIFEQNPARRIAGTLAGYKAENLG